MDNSAPFYLGINHTNASKKADLPGLKWFKPQPMGVNKLDSLHNRQELERASE